MRGAIFSAVFFCIAGAAAATAGLPSSDLRLWYRQPAAAWRESLFIGNGRLGGAVWGGVQQERIDLNEDTLWSGEPYENINTNGLPALPEIRRLLLAGKELEAQKMVEATMLGRYNENYLALGTLKIDFAPADTATNYQRELDLDTAVVRESFEAGGVRYEREIFDSHPAEAIVVRLTANAPGKISFTATLDSQLRHTNSSGKQFYRLAGRCPSHSDAYRIKKNLYDDGPNPKGMTFEGRLTATGEGGKIHFTDAGVVAENCDAVTLKFVAATSFNGPRKSPSRDGKNPAKNCADDLEKISGRSYVKLLAEHTADYQKLFRRVTLDLDHNLSAESQPTDLRLKNYQPGGDPGLAALYYQFGRYLLISSSRLGTQPANLQGIWNNSLFPPWAANWTLNCNAEINYWSVEAANLSECHLPLLELTREISVDGTNVATKLYGARGWMAHHNTDLWRTVGPVSGQAKWAIFQVGSAWLCQHIWEHYAFNGDKIFLREYWPVLAGASQFYLDTLIEEPEHHWLVTGPDTNFENSWRKPDGTRGSVCLGPTASMEMIRELFQNCVRASEILGTDADLRAEIQKALPRLPPMKVSPTTGELQEYLADWPREAHDEALSSWGLICSAQITPRGTPELAAGVKKIFDREQMWRKGQIGSWQGAFQANAYARLQEGDSALGILDTHLQQAVNPNLTARFPGHCDFQIDGNLGQTSAINEMLLQSQVGDSNGIYEVELLPALPKNWRSGHVAGLRARGGFEIEISWQNGELQTATIKSLLGNPLVLRRGARTLTLSTKSGESLQFDAGLNLKRN
jgi:alpha-L-fucosidase 2